MSNVDINVDRDGQTDGQTEKRTPISHPATSRYDKNRMSLATILVSTLRVKCKLHMLLSHALMLFSLGKNNLNIPQTYVLRMQLF